MAGMLKDIVDSIFSPTTKPQAGVVKAMNYSFYALFATLLAMAYATSWNKHVLALSAVAVALYASITWFVSELGKIEDQKKTDGNAPSSSTGEKRSTSKSTPIPSAPGDGSYAEVAAEPPSSTSSAVVSDRSGLSERRTTRSQGQTQSSSNQSSSSRSSDNNNNTSAGEETYAQIAAEAPDSSNNVIRQDKTGRSVNNQSKSGRDVGVVEAAGMSYINKNNNNNQEGGSYADAAAEDPDPQESVVREDRVGRTETK